MINLLGWCLKNQRKIDDITKRQHVACIIKYHNLVERQLTLGRSMSKPVVVPKVGN